MSRKTLYTLDLNFPTEITDLTYPLMRFYAHRIGAEFYIIDKRQWPEAPLTYEKFQIFELAQQRCDEWSIFFDADALIHPETIDFTEMLGKDTVAQHGSDMAAIRFNYNRFMRRDGRNIGSCNWNTWGSEWCIELWEPLKDMTIAEATKQIYPIMAEQRTLDKTLYPTQTQTAEHLIDDYVMSLNIAKYGLKYTTLIDLMPKIGLPDANFFYHEYMVPQDQKIAHLKRVLEGAVDPDTKQVTRGWDLPDFVRSYGQ